MSGGNTKYYATYEFSDRLLDPCGNVSYLYRNTDTGTGYEAIYGISGESYTVAVGKVQTVTLDMFDMSTFQMQSYTYPIQNRPFIGYYSTQTIHGVSNTQVFDLFHKVYFKTTTEYTTVGGDGIVYSYFIPGDSGPTEFTKVITSSNPLTYRYNTIGTSNVSYVLVADSDPSQFTNPDLTITIYEPMVIYSTEPTDKYGFGRIEEYSDPTNMCNVVASRKRVNTTANPPTEVDNVLGEILTFPSV